MRASEAFRPNGSRQRIEMSSSLSAFYPGCPVFRRRRGNRSGRANSSRKAAVVIALQ